MSSLIAILAAGEARRFGSNKLIQACAGKPLGKWALEVAAATSFDIVWVAGDEVPSFVDNCQILINSRADAGIGTSIACSASFAQARGYQRLLLMLADMPLVSLDLISRLSQHDLAAAQYPTGRLGVPAIFPRRMFPALSGLSGGNGAKDLIEKSGDVLEISCDPQDLIDVDSVRDLKAAEAHLNQRVV